MGAAEGSLKTQQQNRGTNATPFCGNTFKDVMERKTVRDNCDSLSVLILSRKRPKILQETLAAMISNCFMIEELINRGQRFSIQVGVDDDDQETLSIIKDWPLIEWRVAPRPMTIGIGYNHLWKQREADFHLVWSDDKIIETQGWDKVILENMSQENLGYVPDKDHARGGVTQYILPRIWSQQADYVAAEWFPYWFIDTWWDHIAAMIGNKKSLPISMHQHPDASGTTGMKDLNFWARFFLGTVKDRMDVANKIRDVLYGEDAERHGLSLLQQEHWLNITRDVMINAEIAEKIEAIKSNGAPSERYEAAKSRAEAYLSRLERE